MWRVSGGGEGRTSGNKSPCHMRSARARTFSTRAQALTSLAGNDEETKLLHWPRRHSRLQGVYVDRPIYMSAATTALSVHKELFVLSNVALGNACESGRSTSRVHTCALTHFCIPTTSPSPVWWLEKPSLLLPTTRHFSDIWPRRGQPITQRRMHHIQGVPQTCNNHSLLGHCMDFSAALCYSVESQDPLLIHLARVSKFRRTNIVQNGCHFLLKKTLVCPSIKFWTVFKSFHKT